MGRLIGPFVVRLGKDILGIDPELEEAKKIADSAFKVFRVGYGMCLNVHLVVSQPDPGTDERYTRDYDFYVEEADTRNILYRPDSNADNFVLPVSKDFDLVDAALQDSSNTEKYPDILWSRLEVLESRIYQTSENESFYGVVYKTSDKYYFAGEFCKKIEENRFSSAIKGPIEITEEDLVLLAKKYGIVKI